MTLCVALVWGFLTLGVVAPIDAQEGGAKAALEDKAPSEDTEDVDPLEAKISEAKLQLLELGACVRSYRFRHDAYPDTLHDLVSRKLLDEILPGPWGGEIKYRLVDLPPQPDQKAVKKSYEITITGADKEFGTADDITLTKDGLRVRLTESQRAAIISEGGDNYHLSRRAWAWEQAFRLWMVIFETEADSGEMVTDLDSVKLPEYVFADGKPVDIFGRTFELRSVRGVRAVGTEKLDEKTPALSLSEGEFAHNLMARVMNDGNYPWRMRYVVQAARSFYSTQGRLPLTMPEVTTTLRNRWWNMVADDGHPFLYLTLNEDKSFIVISCGQNNQPGGINENRDTTLYGPEDVAKTDSGNHRRSSDWEYSDNNRNMFESLKRAINKRWGAESEENGDDEINIPEEDLKNLPEELRKLLEKELKDQKKKDVEKKDEGEEKNDEGEEKNDDKDDDKGDDKDDDKGDAEEKSDEGLKDDASDAEKPSSEPVDEESEGESPAEDPAEDESSEADEESGNSSFDGGTNFAVGPMALPALLAQAEDDAVVDDDKEDPVEVPTYKIATAAELIPIKLFTTNEAQEVGISLPEYEYQLTWPVREVYYAARSYAQMAGPDDPLPVGNIELSNADRFQEVSKDMLGDVDDSEFRAFLITRMARGEYRELTSLVCIGIPEKESNWPIVVMGLLDGDEAGPFFARYSDQPPGWLEQALAFDGEPQSDDVQEDPPSDQPADDPNDKPADGDQAPSDPGKDD